MVTSGTNAETKKFTMDVAGKNGLRGMMPPKMAAAYLGVCSKTIKNWLTDKRRFTKTSRIPHYRIGTRIYFRQEDLDKWLEQRRQST